MSVPRRMLTESELELQGDHSCKQPQFSSLQWSNKASQEENSNKAEEDVGQDLEALVSPHIESFNNYFGDQGLLVS